MDIRGSYLTDLAILYVTCHFIFLSSQFSRKYLRNLAAKGGLRSMVAYVIC